MDYAPRASRSVEGLADRDYPLISTTEQAVAKIAEQGQAGKIRGDVRVSLGRIVTDEELAALRKRDSRPLP